MSAESNLYFFSLSPSVKFNCVCGCVRSHVSIRLRQCYPISQTYLLSHVWDEHSSVCVWHFSPNTEQHLSEPQMVIYSFLLHRVSGEKVQSTFSCFHEESSHPQNLLYICACHKHTSCHIPISHQNLTMKTYCKDRGGGFSLFQSHLLLAVVCCAWSSITACTLDPFSRLGASPPFIHSKQCLISSTKPQVESDVCVGHRWLFSLIVQRGKCLPIVRAACSTNVN